MSIKCRGTVSSSAAFSGLYKREGNIAACGRDANQVISPAGIGHPNRSGRGFCADDLVFCRALYASLHCTAFSLYLKLTAGKTVEINITALGGE